MHTLKVGDVVEPIVGYADYGFTGTVVKICDEQVCFVKFTSSKVTPPVQIRTIQNLIKCG
jgi:hypothetical protein